MIWLELEFFRCYVFLFIWNILEYYLVSNVYLVMIFGLTKTVFLIVDRQYKGYRLPNKYKQLTLLNHFNYCGVVFDSGLSEGSTEWVMHKNNGINLWFGCGGDRIFSKVTGSKVLEFNKVRLNSLKNTNFKKRKLSDSYSGTQN